MYHQYQLQQGVRRSSIDRDTPSTDLVTDRDLNNANNAHSSFCTPSMDNYAPSMSSSPVQCAPRSDGGQQNAKVALHRLLSFSDSSFSSVTLPPLDVRETDVAADDALPLSSPNRRNESPPIGAVDGPNIDGGSVSSSVTSDSTKRTNTPRHSDGTETEAEGTEGVHALGQFVPMQAARAHWMQLYKLDIQMPVLQRMFLRLLQRHAPLRALWPFARCFDANKQHQMDELTTSAAFRHFCATYQASLTMVMDNVDDEPSLCRLLQQLGANHFFYDVNETHFKMMRQEFVLALDECVRGTIEQLNDELAQHWDKLWAKMESNLAFGLAVQRHNYLAHCVTGKEMEIVRAQWQTLLVAKCRLDALGAKINEHGIETFTDALSRIGIKLWAKDEVGQQFAVAVNNLLWAIAQAIALWEPGTGFLRLCAEIDSRCGAAFDLICTCSSALLRKAFIEGFTTQLIAELGEKEATATALYSWTKVYRVAEQAIIADGMDNERAGIK